MIGFRLNGSGGSGTKASYDLRDLSRIRHDNGSPAERHWQGTDSRTSSLCMPVQYVNVSRSQMAEFLGYEPERLLGIRKTSTGYKLIVEAELAQTSGTCPPLSDNIAKRPPRGGKKGK